MLFLVHMQEKKRFFRHENIWQYGAFDYVVEIVK